MPDLEISNLPVLAGASLQADDPIAVADLSAAETKKITVKELLEGGFDLVDDATISAAKIFGSTVGTGAIGTVQLADLAVETGKVADDAITFGKFQNINTNVLLGRVTAGTGSVEEITCTAAGRALLDDADVAAQRTTLGLGTLATQSGTFSGTSSGTNTGDQTITLTGDVTGTGTGSFATTIANNVITTSNVIDNAITYAKIQDISSGDILLGRTTGAGSVQEIACTSAGRDLLADATAADQRTTLGLGDLAVATGTWVNGSSFSGTSSGTNTGDQTIALTGAVTGGGTGTFSTTITAGAVGTTQIADLSVTYGKTNFTNGSIPGAKLQSNSVTATQLSENAVGASELADSSVDTNALLDAAVTDAKLAIGIDGAKLSNDTVTAAKIPTASLDRGLDKTSGSIGHTNAITAGTRSGITFDAQGHITSTVALAAGDMPLATTTEVGAVSVAADSGLTVSGTGAISITNTLTGGTTSGITFDNNGLITATTSLVAGDLPVATTGAIGAVSVPAVGGLEVNVDGEISIAESGVTAGTYPKVTVNNKGTVTTGQSLVAADIPALDASKITSGTFDIARIPANSVTGAKLADSSTVTFAGAGSSEGIVTFPTAAFQGEFFFDAINRDLYLWDGNAWQPVTITSGEIIFAGTYDASTNLVASVTTAGEAAGLGVGSAVPAASANNSQYYLVVSELGTGTAPVPAVALNPPDILLSNGLSWELLDVSSFIASQQATNISFTPFGNIASNNVQTALQELDTEKLDKAGGTITGNLEIGSTGSLTFEGPTPDLFETTLAVADPTADRTLVLPDVDGTIVTTGDTGTVTSAMITDGTIVNADINASAGIAFSKLATLTGAHFLLGNASNVATATQITGDISVSNSGVAAITAGSIVNADINASAAIAASKIVSGSTSGAGVLQLSDSTTSTSTTLAATANAVKVTKDVANAALPKAGGTVTGTLNIAAAGSLVIQDASFNATIDTATLTADRTITLPDTTGTVALTSQLDDGSY